MSDDVKVMRSSFQILGAAAETVRLPRLSLVFGTESGREICDLSGVGIFERRTLSTESIPASQFTAIYRPPSTGRHGVSLNMLSLSSPTSWNFSQHN